MKKSLIFSIISFSFFAASSSFAVPLAAGNACLWMCYGTAPDGDSIVGCGGSQSEAEENAISQDNGDPAYYTLSCVNNG